MATFAAAPISWYSRGGKEQTCTGNYHASEQRKAESVEIGLAAGFEVVCAVVMADECCRAEAQKGENPVDPADDRSADCASRQRLDPQTANHRRVADAQQRLARQGEHGRNGQAKDVFKV